MAKPGAMPSVPLFQVIIRFVKVVLFMSIYFVRLDSKIMAGRLSKMDVPWVGYWSMLFIEEVYHNPLRKIFLAYLCMHRFSERDIHPSIGAMVRVLQDAGDQGFRGVSRVKRRWWLLVTLTLNPSLLGMRSGRYRAILQPSLLQRLTGCCRKGDAGPPDGDGGARAGPPRRRSSAGPLGPSQVEPFHSFEDETPEPQPPGVPEPPAPAQAQV